jgi:HEPN domain-containing protein
MAEAARWLAQAERDLAAARDLARTGHHNVACFQAQQAAEKAAKAVLYARGAEDVFGHSVRELLRSAAASAPALAALDDAAMRLDRLYIPTRYPNGLPGGIPADAFSAADATEAISQAEALLAAARATIG